MNGIWLNRKMIFGRDSVAPSPWLFPVTRMDSRIKLW